MPGVRGGLAWMYQEMACLFQDEGDASSLHARETPNPKDASVLVLQQHVFL